MAPLGVRPNGGSHRPATKSPTRPEEGPQGNWTSRDVKDLQGPAGTFHVEFKGPIEFFFSSFGLGQRVFHVRT